MAGERKKRKMESEKGEGEGEEDGDEEERKMEMFFALIRSTRDVRDRLRGGLNEAKEKGSEDQKKLVEKESKAIWNPTFRPEDFMQDDKSKRPPGDVQEAGPSKREKGEEDDKEDDKGGGGNGIDLNLSL
jgi:hypothetical protein